MKLTQKILTLATISFLLLLSTVASSAPVLNKEYQAVVDTAYNYVNGAAMANQELLASAFDLEFGHMKQFKVDKETGKETISTTSFDDFVKVFKKETKDTWIAKLLMVDIVDDKMAIVKLDFQTAKTHYIDYLVMYKREGSWKIINKTLVANKK